MINIFTIKCSQELICKLRYTIVSTAEHHMKWMIVTIGCGMIRNTEIELNLVS